MTVSRKSKATLADPVRCAIYTRKSTEEGLDQDFNSLDAQREAAEAYIHSQAHAGWTCLPNRYDDGGYTGSNLDRPALQRLLADIEAGQLDCVVTHRVDRLSRSLLDFAKLIEAFAQREAAEAYTRSQGHAGWTCLPSRYDDGGYSGSNLDRPALQRLLADMQAGQIGCVVTHRVDRLSRSLLDFAKLMEAFERHHVAFVSVTQHFNSATSMGRLVLNVLLSFAQFERELIAERTRDK